MGASLQVLPDASLAWAISWQGVALIAEREGLRLKAYKCPAGVWTIGWGETAGVKPGDTMTKDEADAALCTEIQKYADGVRAMCTEYPNENELAGMVSLAYNIGLRDDAGKRGLYYSSVLRLHNAGNSAGAAQAFDLINKVRDPATKQLVVSHGLVVRRAQEKALYLTPDPDSVGAMSGVMPQAVQSEPSMAASPTALTGAGLGAAGVVGVVKDYIPQVKDMFDSLSGIAASIGIAPIHVIMSAIGACGAVVLYRRLRQRHDGVA